MLFLLSCYYLHRRTMGVYAWRMLCAWLAVLAILSSGRVVAQEPIVTNQETFYIPFTIPEESASQPTSVELYVSGDRGQSWALYQQRNPSEGRFSFRAGVDGEFWFSVHTVHSSNATPTHRPEMVVVVDRDKPTLKLTAQATDDGQITAEWHISDKHHLADGLQLEYKTGATGPWQPLSVHGRSTTMPDNSLAGRIAWTVPADSQDICLRAEAKDRAGNLAVLERQLTTNRVDDSMASMPLPAEMPPPTPSATIAPMLPAETPAADLPSAVPNPVASYPSTAAPIPEPVAAQPQWPVNLPPLPSPQTWTPPQATYPPAAHSATSDGWGNNVNNVLPPPQRAPQQQATMPTTNTPSPRPEWITNAFANSGTGPTGMINNPGFATIHQSPSPSGLPSSAKPPVASQMAGPKSSLVTADDWRVSNSRRFHIDYDVDADVNLIHRVEVWYTEDGGQTWRHHGDDEDGQSPYLVTVAADGMFGFRLLVQAKEGLTARPPQPGDPADVWIRVDATSPTAEITSAVFGRGNETGKLQISWNAQDDDLFRNPVSLFYGDQPQGPWQKIAAGLPNTGSYDWIVDEGVPNNIYLRLEVRDRAGNLTVDALSDPLRSDGLTPKSHVRAVRPAAAQTPE